MRNCLVIVALVLLRIVLVALMMIFTVFMIGFVLNVGESTCILIYRYPIELTNFIHSFLNIFWTSFVDSASHLGVIFNSILT